MSFFSAESDSPIIELRFVRPHAFRKISQIAFETLDREE